MNYTAEEVRELAKQGTDALQTFINGQHSLHIPPRDTDPDFVIATCLSIVDAYADLLEQRASGVTDEIVANAAHAYLGEHVGFGHGCDLSQLRDALLAVWPAAAEPSDKAKLSERKTVHEWLNALHIEREEFGKPLCLLRRLRILCDRYQGTCDQLSHELRKQATAKPAQPAHDPDCNVHMTDVKRRIAGCDCSQSHPAPSAQPADSGRVTELLAYLDNQAQHPRDQFGNGSNKPNPTLKAWYAKQAAIVRALAGQGQPATPILNIRCEAVAPDGVKGSTYLPVVRVEAEDDGSFTAVTNYWPAERDEIAEEAWRAFYEAADKVQKESQSNG